MFQVINEKTQEEDDKTETLSSSEEDLLQSSNVCSFRE